MLMSMPKKQDEGFWDDGSVTLAQLNKAEMNHILSKANSMSASQVYLSLDVNHPGLFLRFLEVALFATFFLLLTKMLAFYMQLRAEINKLEASSARTTSLASSARTQSLGAIVRGGQITQDTAANPGQQKQKNNYVLVSLYIAITSAIG
jgi:hypothetical protein